MKKEIYSLIEEPKKEAEATNAKTFEEILSEKDSEIASLKKENERLKRDYAHLLEQVTAALQALQHRY